MNKKIILVVEDEFGLAAPVKIKLENDNFEVLIADNVRDAKDMFNNNDISLIWLDHYLKGNDTGLDFISYVKSKDKNVPVLVITNTASPDEKYSYLGLGADRYFVKTNYTLNQLVEQVVKLVD